MIGSPRFVSGSAKNGSSANWVQADGPKGIQTFGSRNGLGCFSRGKYCRRDPPSLAVWLVQNPTGTFANTHIRFHQPPVGPRPRYLSACFGHRGGECFDGGGVRTARLSTAQTPLHPRQGSRLRVYAAGAAISQTNSMTLVADNGAMSY